MARLPRPTSSSTSITIQLARRLTISRDLGFNVQAPMLQPMAMPTPTFIQLVRRLMGWHELHYALSFAVASHMTTPQKSWISGVLVLLALRPCQLLPRMDRRNGGLRLKSCRRLLTRQNRSHLTFRNKHPLLASLAPGDDYSLSVPGTAAANRLAEFGLSWYTPDPSAGFGRRCSTNLWDLMSARRVIPTMEPSSEHWRLSC